MTGYGLSFPTPRTGVGRSAVRQNLVGSMPDDALWTRDITLASQATSTAQARRFVRQHLDANHLEALVDDVELVASSWRPTPCSMPGRPST